MSVLQEKVLVLNRGWRPIDVTTVRSAVSLVYQDAARILDPTSYETFDFQGWVDAKDFAQRSTAFLQGYRCQLPAPEIIVLRNYGGTAGQVVKFSRRNVFLRDRYTCQYCAVGYTPKELTIDHVVPRSRGGPNSWTNCVTSCEDCNTKKANRTPQECGLTLLKEPRMPKWTPIAGMLPVTRPDSWDKFLKIK